MADTNTQTNTNPAGNEGNANPDGNSGNNAAGGGNSTRTYTQEEVNRFVEDREKRAAKSALKDFYQKQGLTEAEANEAIQKFLENKQKNSPETLNTQLTGQLAQVQKELATEKLNRAAEKVARTLGADEKSIDYIIRLADLDGVMADDGKISTDKVTEAVKKVMDDVPAFKPAAEGTGIKVGGDGEQNKRSNNNTPSTPKKKWNRFNN